MQGEKKAHTNVLRADEVLPVREISRNGKLNAVLVPGAPGVLGEVGILVANAFFVNLEPVTITLIGLGAAWSLGHVHQGRARMLHSGPDGELHSKLGAGLHLSRACLAGEGKGAFVAAEVGHIRCHVVANVLPLGRVVLGRAGVGANELVASGLLAIDNKDVKEIMGRHKWHQGHGSKKGQLHLGKSRRKERLGCWYKREWNGTGPKKNYYTVVEEANSRDRHAVNLLNSIKRGIGVPFKP